MLYKGKVVWGRRWSWFGVGVVEGDGDDGRGFDRDGLWSGIEAADWADWS